MATAQESSAPIARLAARSLPRSQTASGLGQEPDWDEPDQSRFALRQGRSGPRRRPRVTAALRYPDEDGKRKLARVSWDQAIDEIGDKLLDIRQKGGPGSSVYWLGSAKFTNEAAYLNPQVRAPLGNEQLRIIKRASATPPPSRASPTPGATAPMTNSYNDIRNAKTIMIMGR